MLEKTCRCFKSERSEEKLISPEIKIIVAGYGLVGQTGC